MPSNRNRQAESSVKDRVHANRQVLDRLTETERTAAEALDQVVTGLRELDQRVQWLNRAAGSVFVLVGIITLVAGAAGGLIVAV